MAETPFAQGNLVLYKNRPARVAQAGDKLEIEIAGGKTQKVRSKDVALLHPGPVQSANLQPPAEAEIETAWELLVGGRTTLAELAELAYGSYTPATAWAAWQWVADGLYFSGPPEEIVALDATEVENERQKRAHKAAKEEAWAAFLQRLQAGHTQPEDQRYLKEIEDLACGRTAKSRALDALGRAENPENAHALLLSIGHWDHAIVPYPQRLNQTTTAPAADLPQLPEETRLDLTHLASFAIDDEGNRDPDDALSLDGNRLWVHVADVAALVTPDSAADLEARARGANLYLPDVTVPMLPPQATELLGLGLNEVSPALSFGLDLDAEGQIAHVEIAPSWVRVERLTYAQADARLEETPLQQLCQLAENIQGNRWANDATFIEWPEVKIRVEDGQVHIAPLPPLRSRDLVTEAMLLTGQAAARFAIERQIPIPFTTQDPPVERDDFIVDEGLAGMFARRRTFKPSQLRTAPGPHAGLGLDEYARATSPLRRYLDLVVHQQLRAFVLDQNLLDDQQILERVGAAETVAAGVRHTERLCRQHWTLVYLMQQPNWSGEAVLVDVRGRRGQVVIPTLALEESIHLDADLPLNSIIPLRLEGINLPHLSAHFGMGN
tara:strand:- start:169 stop:1998 length:1830 start_codon:yes stop_codon:yes gene_type:complete